MENKLSEKEKAISEAESQILAILNDLQAKTGKIPHRVMLLIIGKKKLCAAQIRFLLE